MALSRRWTAVEEGRGLRCLLSAFTSVPSKTRPKVDRHRSRACAGAADRAVGGPAQRALSLGSVCKTQLSL